MSPAATRTLLMLVFPLLAALAFTLAIAMGGATLGWGLLAAAGAAGCGLAAIRLRLLTARNLLLLLWVLLMSHRAFLGRTESVETEGGTDISSVFVEVLLTGIVFAGVAILALARFVRQRSFRLTRTRLLLLAYTAFAALSLMWTPSRPYAGFWLMRLGSAVMIFILYFQEADLEDCRLFAWFTLIGQLPNVALPLIASISSAGTLGRRATGFWFHPGVASILAFSVGMILLTIVLQEKRKLSRQVLLGGLAAFSFASGFLAAGKTGAAGAGVAFLGLMLIGFRPRVIFRAFLALALAAPVVWYVAPMLNIGLFAHLTYYDESVRLGTLYSRIDLWHGALYDWTSSLWSMLLGWGFTATRIWGIYSYTGAWSAAHAHNSFLETLLEVGVIGALPVFWIVWRTIVILLRTRHRLADSPTLPLCVGWIVLMVGSLSDNVFGGLLHPQTYLFLGLVVTIEAIALRERNSTRQVPWRPA